MKSLITFIVVLLSFQVTAAKYPPTVSLKYLSSDLSAQAVNAAMKDCTKRGYKVAVALVGRDGNLLAFTRNPLSGPHSVKVSQRKAFTAATFQVSTWSLRDRNDLARAPGILLIRGGLPVVVGGQFYGGIAVSGAEPSIDEKCAKAGIEAITEAIEFAD